MIELGSKVYLRASRVGEPGTVIRKEHRKLVVYWIDLDYFSRVRTEALELALPEKGCSSETDTRA